MKLLSPIFQVRLKNNNKNFIRSFFKKSEICNLYAVKVTDEYVLVFDSVRRFGECIKEEICKENLELLVRVSEIMMIKTKSETEIGFVNFKDIIKEVLASSHIIK